MIQRNKGNWWQIFLICWLVWTGNTGNAQWSHPDADPTFPRSLCKVAEIPALLTHLQTQPAHQLYLDLWNDAQNYSVPASLPATDGQRRKAAFNAKNAAFFYLLDHKPLPGGTLIQLSPSESTALRNKAIALLELQNTQVEAFPQVDPYLWRSNQLINNVIAYDLLKGAQVPDSLLATGLSLLMDMSENLYAQVKGNFLNLGFFGFHVNNHALRTSGALGMAGLILSDEAATSSNRNPENWFQLAIYQIDNVLWRSSNAQSRPGLIGGYAEGPHYLRFGMKHVLPFFHALHNYVPLQATFTGSFDGNTRTIDHPWFDPNYEYLFSWVPRIRLPDGRSPALEDAFVATAWEELAIMERPEWCIDVDYSRWHPAQPDNLWEMLHHSSDDIVADYLASQTYDAVDTFPLFQALPEAGNLVMRSSWDSAATWLHFTAKHGKARNSARGHNQADEASFTLFSHGQMLALDPGYLKWSRREEVSRPEHHNLLLINGNGPGDGTSGSGDTWLEKTFDLQSVDLGRVWTEIHSTQIERRPLMVRRDYVILFDQLERANPADFTFQLHGYGLAGGDSLTGTFTRDGTGRSAWSRNGVTLTSLTLAANGYDQLEQSTNRHEWRYDSTREHTVVRINANARTEARFLTALIPHDTSEQFGLDTIGSAASLAVHRDGFSDLITLEAFVPASQKGLSNVLEQDGKLALRSEDGSGVWQALSQLGGQTLVYGGDTLWTALQISDWALERLDAATVRGYQSGGGNTLYIKDLGFTPQSVNGMQVQSWNYDAVKQRLEIQMGGAGYFLIHESLVVGAESEQISKLSLYPNPAQEFVNIQTPDGNGTLTLLDLNGRMVRQQEVERDQNHVWIGDLEAGLYLVVWENSKTQLIARLQVR